MSSTAATRDEPLLPAFFGDHLVCVLTRLGLSTRRLVDSRLEPLALKLRHYTVLRSLAERGPLPQHALGELLGIDPATTATTLDDLEQAGLVDRTREPQNRRRYALELTADGRRTLARAESALDELDAAVLAELGRDERKSLRDLVGVLAFGEAFPALARAEGAAGGGRRRR